MQSQQAQSLSRRHSYSNGSTNLQSSMQQKRFSHSANSSPLLRSNSTDPAGKKTRVSAEMIAPSPSYWDGNAFTCAHTRMTGDETNVTPSLHVLQFMVPASKAPGEGVYVPFGAKDWKRSAFSSDVVSFDRLKESQREVELAKQRIGILEQLMSDWEGVVSRRENTPPEVILSSIQQADPTVGSNPLYKQLMCIPFFSDYPKCPPLLQHTRHKLNQFFFSSFSFSSFSFFLFSIILCLFDLFTFSRNFSSCLRLWVNSAFSLSIRSRFS